MSRRASLILVVVVALLMPAAAFAASHQRPAAHHHRKAQPRRSVPADFFGVNWDEDIAFFASPAIQNAQFARMAASGVETVRASFLWADAQPQSGGPVDFSETDRLVGMAASHGLSVLPIVIDAPGWAREFPTEFSPPSSPSDYAAYLTALIGRYGPHGSFWSQNPHLPRMAIRAWQIWNEPNMGYQWDTSGAAQDWAVPYSYLLKTAYQAIKAADRGALVVMAGFPNDSPAELEHLYQFGVHGSFDVVSLHPYTATAAGVLTLAREARAVMKKYGDAKTPMWLTEMGLPASRGRSTSTQDLQTSDTGMAKFLTATYSEFEHTLNSPAVDVSRIYWYTWASDYPAAGGSGIFGFAGLMQWATGDPVVRPRPAYTAYVASARRFEACVKTSTARCR